MALHLDDLAVGHSCEEVVVDDLTRTQIVMYAGASGDYNPLHSDEPFARHAGFPGVFAHGMLSMGLTGKMLTNWVGNGRLRTFGVRFRAQVWPGDTLTTRAEVTGLRKEAGENLVDLAVTTVNQRDEIVMTGTASAAVEA
jgi:acyl dehydratase